MLARPRRPSNQLLQTVMLLLPLTAEGPIFGLTGIISGLCLARPISVFLPATPIAARTVGVTFAALLSEALRFFCALIFSCSQSELYVLTTSNCRQALAKQQLTDLRDN